MAVGAFDTPTISLVKDTFWLGWLISAVITCEISIINCIIAMKQIENFDISYINK